MELNTPEHVHYSNRLPCPSPTVPYETVPYEYTDVEWLLPQLGTVVAHSSQKGRRVISGYESLSLLCSERLLSKVKH